MIGRLIDIATFGVWTYSDRIVPWSLNTQVSDGRQSQDSATFCLSYDSTYVLRLAFTASIPEIIGGFIAGLPKGIAGIFSFAECGTAIVLCVRKRGADGW